MLQGWEKMRERWCFYGIWLGEDLRRESTDGDFWACFSVAVQDKLSQVLTSRSLSLLSQVRVADQPGPE